MKKTIILFLCCLIGYQGCPQKNQITAVQSNDTSIEWTEQEIIDILKKGDASLFCKYDLFLERNDTSFYIKNMELLLPNDLFFDSAYIESSITYGESKKDQKDMHCSYLIMNDKWGNALELTEDELAYLPKLAKYLDVKVQKTPLNECNEYLPLDWKYASRYSGEFFYW